MTKSILCEEALPDQRSLYSTCAGVRTIFSIAADPIPNSPSWTMQPQGTNEIEYIQWSINERFEKLRCILIRTNKVNEPSHSMICKRLYLFSYFKLLPSFPSLLSSTSLSLSLPSFFLSFFFSLSLASLSFLAIRHRYFLHSLFILPFIVILLFRCSPSTLSLLFCCHRGDSDKWLSRNTFPIFEKRRQPIFIC